MMATSLRRYEQITSVLIKYGFEVAVREIIPGIIQWKVQKKKTKVNNESVARRVRFAIQELGPTFVKFGQIMSTRRDLISPEIIKELKLLTDKVEPVPFNKIKPIIEENIGPISENFIYLNERPFAAASLSQVHHGKLNDGTLVVLKVQRPGIKEVIETDLRILYSFSERAERLFPEMEIFNFPDMVKDFSKQILRELDFVRDGKNAEILAHNMREFKDIKFPKIYWKYSSNKLLVMEYIKGVRIDKIDQLRLMGIDPKEIALKGFRAYMKQIFVDGFFHGDPHSGNLIVTRSGELAFLDYGLVGLLRPEKKDKLLKLFLAILDKDVDDIVKIFKGIGVPIRDPIVDSLKDDLYLALIESEDFNPDQTESRALEGVTVAMRRYKLKVPMVAMLMIKVIMMLEEDAHNLYSEFNLVNEIKPYLGETLKQHFLSQVNIRKLGINMIEGFLTVGDFPQNVNEVLKKAATGNIRFKIAHDDLNRIERSIDQATYKMLFGVLLASLVIGISMFVFSIKEILSPQIIGMTVVIYIIIMLVVAFTLLQVIRGKH